MPPRSAYLRCHGQALLWFHQLVQAGSELWWVPLPGRRSLQASGAWRLCLRAAQGAFNASAARQQAASDRSRVLGKSGAASVGVSVCVCAHGTALHCTALAVQPADCAAAPLPAPRHIPPAAPSSTSTSSASPSSSSSHHPPCASRTRTHGSWTLPAASWRSSELREAAAKLQH